MNKLTDTDKNAARVISSCLEVCETIEKLENSPRNGISVDQIQKVNDLYSKIIVMRFQDCGNIHASSVNRFFKTAEAAFVSFAQKHTVIIDVTFKAENHNFLSVKGINGDWDTGLPLKRQENNKWFIQVPRSEKDATVSCKLICQSTSNNNFEWQPSYIKIDKENPEKENLEIEKNNRVEIGINGLFSEKNSYTITMIPQNSVQPVQQQQSSNVPQVQTSNNNNNNMNIANQSQGFVAYQSNLPLLAPPQNQFYNHQQPSVNQSQVNVTLSQAEQQNVQAIAARAKNEGVICFYDDGEDPLTGVFGNFHKCQITFNNVKFSNTEAIFQSQKFTDQPQIFSQFDFNTDGGKAVNLGKKISTARSNEWHGFTNTGSYLKQDVMMDALRAKFSQNPALKAYLMATGTACLIEHLPSPRSDKDWSDAYDGSGKNWLGESLMKLRAEFGGTGIVPRPQAYQQNPIGVGGKYYNNGNVQPSQNNAFNNTAQKAHNICVISGCNRIKHPGSYACGLGHRAKLCVKCHKLPKNEPYNQCNRNCIG